MTRPLPDGRVSRNTPVSKPVPSRQGGMARIQEGEGVISCSCGAAKIHNREKVRGDWAERHVDKKHGGRSIWL